MLVSGAAGAVGSIAGQIAKIAGCRVVGTTSGAENAPGSPTNSASMPPSITTSAEFSLKDVRSVPNGVDVYFDNTGGEVLDAALSRMNMFGRVACCGNVSQYNATTPAGGPAGVPGFLVTKRIRMEGFVVMDFYNRRAQAEAALAGWVEQGKLKAPVDIVEGFENMPKALEGLFAGKNKGKLMVRV